MKTFNSMDFDEVELMTVALRFLQNQHSMRLENKIFTRDSFISSEKVKIPITKIPTLHEHSPVLIKILHLPRSTIAVSQVPQFSPFTVPYLLTRKPNISQMAA